MDNNNRKGYKHTSVGWIPEDWKDIELIQLSTNGISNGVFNDPEKVGSGYRLINVIDLYNEPSINSNKLNKLNISFNEFDKNKVNYGDIFFTRSSLKLEGIAHCNIILDHAEDITFDGHIMKLTPNQEIVYPPYLRLYCISQPARQFFMKRAKQNTMTTIGQGDISDLPIAIPSLLEQKSIIHLVNKWDRAIETIENLITAKEQLKKGFMQQLLTGKERLPGFNGEWKVLHLGELFSERNEFGHNDLPLLSITAERGVIYQTETENKDNSNDDKSKYRRICPGDIGYNTMRMWQGRSALSTLEGIVSPAYTIVKPNENAFVSYFAYLFKLPSVINLFYRNSQGLVSDTLNCKYHDFARIKITIPEREEQIAIANILSTIDKEISLLKSQLELYKQQKKGLMQVLLTGAVRVKF